MAYNKAIYKVCIQCVCLILSSTFDLSCLGGRMLLMCSAMSLWNVDGLPQFDLPAFGDSWPNMCCMPQLHLAPACSISAKATLPVVLLWPCDLCVRVSQALPPVRRPASHTAQSTWQRSTLTPSASKREFSYCCCEYNQLTAVDANGASAAQKA
jgi:hypothetical protein